MLFFFLSDFYWSLEGWGGSWGLGPEGVSGFMFLCVYFGLQGPRREWNFLCKAAGRRKSLWFEGVGGADGSTKIQKETISRVPIKLCCWERGCSLGIMATGTNSHSSKWQSAFTASLDHLAQPSVTNLPVKAPCQKSLAHFPTDRYNYCRPMDRQTLLFHELLYQYSEDMFISILQ